MADDFTQPCPDCGTPLAEHPIPVDRYLDPTGNHPLSPCPNGMRAIANAIAHHFTDGQ